MNFPFSLPFFLDGATGTELLKRGMKEGDCTERFILENKEVFQQLQKEYIAAGASALLAPTFGANLPTLLRHGYAEEEADDIVKALVAVTKEIAGDTELTLDETKPEDFKAEDWETLRNALKEARRTLRDLEERIDRKEREAEDYDREADENRYASYWD